MYYRPSSRRSGFSLIELVITMTIMAILVGVVSMRSGALTTKAQANKVAQTVETYKTACTMYFGDTGVTPLEYTGYTGATYHRLSQDPSVAGWSGPYIERPISQAESPVNSTVHLYASAVYANSDGFDIDGDGTADIAANAANTNVLAYWGVSAELAKAVDSIIDKSSATADWANTGRVEFNGSNHMTILVRW
ncbi:MAG: prepilin-type N-terminal cleavage/methylation domain-containing protein [Planctomycetota bacterium]